MSLASHKIRRVLAFSGIAVITAASLAACSSEGASSDGDCTPAHEFETINPGELVVGAYEVAPYVVIEDDETLSGWEGDLITKFADENCLDLVVSAAGGASAVIPSVQSGRADVGITDWYRTKERAKLVNLSYPHSLDLAAIISKDGLTVDDLEGKKVSSVAGNLWNDSLQKKFGDNFTVYQDTEAITKDLEAGRIDAMIESKSSVTARLESTGSDLQIVEIGPLDGVPEFDRPGQTTWVTSLDNDSIGEALDATIKGWHEDGTIEQAFEDYGLDPEQSKIDEVWEL
ncbi:substrate-binding periplasmic protein [Leucobacter sp. GX24907]